MPINMQYCKYSNTLLALEECTEGIIDGDQEELSQFEQTAKEKLIDMCIDIASQIDYDEDY